LLEESLESREEIGAGPNDNGYVRQEISRTPIMSIYNLPETLNQDPLSQGGGDYPMLDLGQQQLLELSENMPTVERHRTPVDSFFNLPATTEPAEVTPTPQSVLYYERTPVVAEEMRQPAERPQSIVFAGKTPEQSYYNLQATVDSPTMHLQGYPQDFVDGTPIEAMPETVNIPKKTRTPVQSMYNIPATVNRSFARVEGNLASDLNQQRRQLVQPKRRTPVISIFNLPATVGRLSSVSNMENFINWTPNNPDTQLPNSNNLLRIRQLFLIPVFSAVARTFSNTMATRSVKCEKLKIWTAFSLPIGDGICLGGLQSEILVSYLLLAGHGMLGDTTNGPTF
jgi:hypothetical protein